MKQTGSKKKSKAKKGRKAYQELSPITDFHNDDRFVIDSECSWYDINHHLSLVALFDEYKTVDSNSPYSFDELSSKGMSLIRTKQYHKAFPLLSDMLARSVSLLHTDSGQIEYARSLAGIGISFILGRLNTETSLPGSFGEMSADAIQSIGYNLLEAAVCTALPALSTDPTLLHFVLRNLNRATRIDRVIPKARHILNLCLLHMKWDSFAISLATLLPEIPASIEDSHDSLARAIASIETLLAKPVIRNSPDEDPYTFFLSLATQAYYNHFSFGSFSLRDTIAKYYALSIKAVPDLHFVSPHIAQVGIREIRNRDFKKLRIGYVSKHFTFHHSIYDDFSGVIQRLPRDAFEIWVFHIGDTGNKMHDLTDPAHEVVIPLKLGGWLDSARQTISSKHLDIVLFAGVSLCPYEHQLAMSRLAPVQAVSHGHPVTSGFSRQVMDYYISWGSAELPSAQDHYTEKLILLGGQRDYQHATPHQYHERRLTDEGLSVITGKPFSHLSRQHFADSWGVPIASTWYVCMQQPKKWNPVFDMVLADILAADPAGRLVLHAPDKGNRGLLRARLSAAGVLDERLHFVEFLPHHELLALYSMADVILDSIYFGGCTTTREILEVMKI